MGAAGEQSLPPGELVGALHLHSDCSDGGLSPRAVVAQAHSAGLDFLLLTDHDRLAPLPEGYHGRVLVLVGVEVSPPRNHYLALGIDRAPAPQLPPRRFVAAVREAGGAGFVAHPHDQGNPLLRLPAYPWDAWDAADFDGLEIWNAMSEWCARTRTPWGLLLALAFPRGVLRGPPAATLRLWDRLGQTRAVPGIAGVDAHQISLRLGRRRVVLLPYARQLGTLRTHVLPEEPLAPEGRRAAEQVRRLLVAGRSFLANAEGGDARGFRFTASGTAVGQQIPFRPGTVLSVRVPAAAQVQILRDGRAVWSGQGRECVFPAPGPGVYRVVARRRWALRARDWILSNPIYLREAR
jgi:hypothetical protein